MAKRMDLLITMAGEIDNAEVYEKVKEYGMNVISVGNEVWVHGTVLSGDPVIGKIVKICAQYGDFDVHLKLL